MKTIDLLRLILTWVVPPLVLVSFLVEALSVDVRFYLGLERVAAKVGTFPTNLDTVWEVKPVGNRFIFYVLDQFASPWFGSGLYEIIVKIIPAIIALAILWWFARMVARKWGVPFRYPFLIAFLGIFAIGNFVILEPEWTAVVLILLMTALLLLDRRWPWWIAGFLVAPLLLLKGITVLMAPLPLIAYFLVTGRGYRDAIQHLPETLEGLAAGALLTILAWLTIFPHMVQDFLLSAAISKVGYMDIFRRLDIFGYFTFGLVGFVPIILVGAMVGFLGCCYALPKDRRDLGLLVLLWLVPTAMVFIQSEFFYYHYYPMVFAAVFTSLWALKKVPRPDLWFTAIMIVTVALWAVLVTGWSPALHGTPWAFWADRTAGADAINARFNLSGQPEILYLDEGGGPWFFGTPSACRYVTPLPIQRSLPDWNISTAPGYWDEWNCIMNYQGEFIFSDNNWMRWNISNRAPLKAKIDAGYDLVWNSSEGKPTAWLGEDVYRRKA